MTARSARITRPWRAVADPPAALGALALVLLVLAAGAFVLWMHAPIPYERVDPYLATFVGPHSFNACILLIAPPFDSAGQRLAHLTVVLLTAGLVVWRLRVGPARGGGRVIRLLASLPLLVALTLVWAGLAAPASGQWTRAAVLLLVLALGFPRLRRLLHSLLAVMALVMLAVAIIPAPFWRLDLTSKEQWVVLVEWHFAMVMGPAELLAAGHRLFGEVTPAYGVWPAVLAAAAGRWYRPLTWGDDVRLLQAMQAVYLLGAALLYWRHGRGRGAWLFAGLLLVVPWYHFSQPGLENPNLTPWRLVAMPLALLGVSALARAGPGITALATGAIAGTAVLFNLESGLALLGGLLAFIALRFRLLERLDGGGALLRAAATFAMGLCSAVLLLAMTVALLLGPWPDLAQLPAIAAVAVFISRSGYSGVPLAGDVFPVVMVAHAAFVLLRISFARSSGFRSSFRALIATTLLVFCAYYANRPHPASVGPLLLLYAFLFVDLLRWLHTRVARRRVSAADALAVAVLVVVAAPAASERLVIAAEQLREGLRSLGRIETVSGVKLSAEWAREAVERAAFLRGLGTRSVYLTSDSYLISKLAGPPALPFLDLAVESLDRPRYQRFLERLGREAPDRLYLDAPGTLAHDLSLFRPLYEEARRDLGRDYRRRGRRGGWEEWSRVGDDLRERGLPEGWDDSLRIVAVGGASVEGRGLAAGWPERLGRLLGGRAGRVSVLNAGMDGQTVAGHEALLGRGLASLRPQVALLLVGLHDAPLVGAAVGEGPLDLAAQDHLDLAGRRPAKVMEACRATWVPAQRESVRAAVAAYRAAGIRPVLITHPALFGRGTDHATGVDLATVVVHSGARINGALARDVLEAFNDVVREVGRSAEVPVIDLAAGFPLDSRLFQDLVQFSDEGAEEAARRIAAGLLATLPEPGPALPRRGRPAPRFRTKARVSSRRYTARLSGRSRPCADPSPRP